MPRATETDHRPDIRHGTGSACRLELCTRCRGALAVVAATAVASAVSGQGVITVGSATRSCTVWAQIEGGGPFDIATFSTFGPDAIEPVSVVDSATIVANGAQTTVTFSMDSSFDWHHPGDRILSSFTTTQTFTVAAEEANGAYALVFGLLRTIVSFGVDGLAEGQTKAVRLVGHLDGGPLEDGFITLQKSGVFNPIYFAPTGAFDVTLQLGNGWYTLQATIEGLDAQMCCGAPSALDYTQGLSVTIIDLTPVATGCGDGGTCFGQQIGPYCDDALCCATVCATLPTCCTIRWDAACAAAATFACGDAEPLSRPVRNPDNGHRVQLLGASSWTFAAEQATALGGELVTVRSAVENEWLRRWMGNQHGVSRPLWLGLHRADASSPFAWRSGEPVSYTNWAPGQPSGSGSAARMAPSSGLWSNPVAFATHGVVEYRQAACAADAGDCMVANGTPGCAQSSCCNIICDELDPACCAIAWDATCAAWAVQYCNPTIATGPFEYEGKLLYLLTPSAATEAQRYARSIGGNLVTVGNMQKLFFLYDTVRNSLAPWVRMWIGLTNEATEGIFEWMDGSPVDFTYWGFGQPAAGQEGEHFVWMDVEATWRRTTNASSFLLHGVVEVEPQCGLPLIGECFGPSAWPFCSDGDCCASVCALVPTCCDGAWDQLCVLMAHAVCTLPCPADFNGDGIVDGADLGALLGAWSSASPTHDLDGDGLVDGADLGLLLGAWGACP